jgi:hypothetical protein
MVLREGLQPRDIGRKSKIPVPNAQGIQAVLILNDHLVAVYEIKSVNGSSGILLTSAVPKREAGKQQGNPG